MIGLVRRYEPIVIGICCCGDRAFDTKLKPGSVVHTCRTNRGWLLLADVIE